MEDSPPHMTTLRRSIHNMNGARHNYVRALFVYSDRFQFLSVVGLVGDMQHTPPGYGPSMGFNLFLTACLSVGQHEVSLRNMEFPVLHGIKDGNIWQKSKIIINFAESYRTACSAALRDYIDSVRRHQVSQPRSQWHIIS